MFSFDEVISCLFAACFVQQVVVFVHFHTHDTFSYFDRSQPGTDEGLIRIINNKRTEMDAV